VSAAAAPTARTSLRLCAWCLAAVIVEIAFYLSYRGHDARYHWFTHFFVGGSVALLVMTAVTLRTHRPVPLPLLWILLAHAFAMTPDFLFVGGRVHERWMDLFLGHLSSHYVPGRNLTWYVVFLACLALYLAALDHGRTKADAGT
jgi:hypothetical protein